MRLLLDSQRHLIKLLEHTELKPHNRTSCSQGILRKIRLLNMVAEPVVRSNLHWLPLGTAALARMPRRIGDQIRVILHHTHSSMPQTSSTSREVMSTTWSIQQDVPHHAKTGSLLTLLSHRPTACATPS